MSKSIRHSTLADIDCILTMLDNSRSIMRQNGNLSQWVGYPTVDDITADINAGCSYVVMEQGCAVGTFALVPGIEPTYGIIEHGRWIEPNRHYCTVHRLAKAPGAKGITRFILDYSASQCDYLRADTHADNHIVRSLFEAYGFVYSGIVYMDDGSPRRAYEWWRYDEVPVDLKAYVENEILPQYRHFDTAHREQHARRVIARAMEMALRLDADPRIVYTAAAMHDIGLAEGRELHHIASGTMIRADRHLLQWFSPAEVEQIAEAAEDHRASANHAPRSLEGCIVAEADRDVEPETIIRRTVEYGLSHYPELDHEAHWQRTLQHLHEKYAEGGYIKLWLDDSPNRQPLEELRALIHDEVRLRKLFETFMP